MKDVRRARVMRRGSLAHVTWRHERIAANVGPTTTASTMDGIQSDASRRATRLRTRQITGLAANLGYVTIRLYHEKLHDGQPGRATGLSVVAYV
jgi:hypothetical protein